MTRSLADHQNDTKSRSECQTRPGDISSDDDDEEGNQLFEPSNIDQFSIPGRLLQKWLIGARRTLGGPFPRPNAKSYAKLYIESLKKSRKDASPRSPRIKMHNVNRWGPMNMEDFVK